MLGHDLASQPENNRKNSKKAKDILSDIRSDKIKNTTNQVYLLMRLAFIKQGQKDTD